MAPDSNTFHWLLLHRLLTPPMLRRLALRDCSGAPEQWLKATPARLAALGLNAAALAALERWRGGADRAAGQCAERDLAWLEGRSARLLHLHHPAYPPLLREIADPPPCLYVLGDADCLSAPQLALVGSRHPTRQGLADAGFFAAALARGGFTVTSGLAYGIDAAGHEAALAAGGRSVAVLGSGLDIIYPSRHRELARAVAENGALVSELPLGSPPRAAHFPSRNRIISGLSLGVLVVEAALQSGSLVTARLALEQNREVFALPGSIHNPASRGCNGLIRGGAKLVLEVQDILDELKGWSQPPLDGAGMEPARAADVPLDLTPVEAAILAAVGYQPTSLDAIVAATAAAPHSLSELLAALSELELRGLVENRAGAWLRGAG